MAVNTAFRASAGSMPIPTFSRSVACSAVYAADMPPEKKRSSVIQMSSRPSCSISRARGAMSSGGRSRWNITPISLRVMPGSSQLPQNRACNLASLQ